MAEIDYDRLAEALDRRRNTVGGASDDGVDTTKLKKSINFIDAAFGDLGKGLSSTITQLNYGQQGLSSLNYTIQGADQFLKNFSNSLLGNFPLLGGVFKGATDAIASYVQAVNQSADAQFATYQQLAKIGGADQFTGLTQVNLFANQLGYVSRADLPKFAALISDSSEALAALGGTVEGGLTQFAALGTAIQKTAIGVELQRMGYDPDQQNKALMGLIKNINATGGSLATLGKTADQQAKAVQDYIKQQDIVTRLTGLSAEAQQKAYEQALTNDRFALEQYNLQRDLAKAKAAPDANTEQGRARTAQIQAQINYTQGLASMTKLVGPELAKGILDLRSGAISTKEAQRAFQLLTPETQALLKARPATAEEATATQLKLIEGLQKDLGTKIDQFQGIIGLGVTPEMIGPLKDLLPLLAKQIPGLEALLAESTGGGAKTEANLANVVATRQNLAELTSEMNRFINEGIGPVTNATVKFTQELREKGLNSLKALQISDYMTAEQRRRYEAETGGKAQGVGLGESPAFERNKEELRQELRTRIETARDVINQAIDQAGDAVDDVTKRLKKSLDDMGDMLRNWNRSLPSFPVSGVSFNSSSMSRLLNDYRNAAGPENRYEPSLVDAVYRPSADNQSNKSAAADFVAESGQASEAQLTAYETMIRQQSELIDLLQRSVGIQDRTLRATYNA